VASREIIAKRYANALWLLSENVEGARGALEALSVLTRAFVQNKDLSAVLESPSFSQAEKQGVMKSLLAPMSAPKKFCDFAQYLLQEGRISLLPEVEEIFRGLVMVNENSIDVNVESALPLSEQQIATISQLVGRLTQKTPILNVQIDRSLVAGLRMNMGGKTFDVSLASNFESLARQLRHASSATEA